MSRIAKYTIEGKVEAIKRYLIEEASARKALEWAAIYRENGIESFDIKQGNNSYTAEEKQRAVEEYLQEKGSLLKICWKHKYLTNGR